LSVSGKSPPSPVIFFLVVASWFLRRSGSRVSILIACRRTVPVALSLCVNPMPSRITRKSTRPRVADRTMVDTVQPRVLASFRNRSASSLLIMKMQLLRWNNAEPTPGPDTRPASSMVRGTGCRGENPRLRRRKKNVLDIPSYRTGDSASLRLPFAFFPVNGEHAALSVSDTATGHFTGCLYVRNLIQSAVLILYR
jgi:hypothetical protein